MNFFQVFEQPSAVSQTLILKYTRFNTKFYINVASMSLNLVAPAQNNEEPSHATILYEISGNSLS